MSLNTWFAVVSFLIMGCASGPTRPKSVASHESPAKALQTLQNGIQKATLEEVTVLSPNHYKKALEWAETSKLLFQKGATLDEIYSSIDKAQSELDLAVQISNLSRAQLKDSLERRAIAKEVLSQSEKKAVAGLDNLQNDFEEGEKEFKALTRAIENGDSDWARNHQSDSIEVYNRLISQGSHKTSLDEVERLVQQATHEGSKKYVPKTHVETLKKLDLASRQIAQDPRNKERVQKIRENIQFQARRLLELTRAAKDLSEKEPEETALWIESRLHSIGTLVTNDSRDKKFEDQVTGIQSSITYMKKTGKVFEGEKKKLEAELAVKGKAYAFEEKAKNMKNLFTNDEAEVLRDGRKITIRLKSLRFPPGQAGLSSENFPVLERVQKAIALFPNSKITVEGHTDSLGSSSTNQRLSLERARSVRGYLLSSGKVTSQQVTIAGLGFAKPLTSDKTEIGRATNRRIDVILETE